MIVSLLEMHSRLEIRCFKEGCLALIVLVVLIHQQLRKANKYIENANGEGDPLFSFIMFSRKWIQWNVWKQKFGLQTIETTLMNIYPYLRNDGFKGHLHSIFPHNLFAIVPMLLICLLAVLKYASHWELNTYLTMLVWINGIKIWRFLKAIIQSHLEKWQIKIKVFQDMLGRWWEGRKMYLFSFLSILWLFEMAKWMWLNPIW